MSHPYLKYFEEQKAQTEHRISHDIERHRKGFASLHLTDEHGNALKNAKVHIHQTSHDFKFGCNLFMLNQFPDDEHNQKYAEEFAKIFNYAIAPFYWCDFELKDGTPRFGKNPETVYRRPGIEEILAYCKANRIQLKGHPLFWHHFLPEWLGHDKDEAYFRIDRRLKEIAGEYADHIRDWDTVNESLSRPSHSHDNRLPADYVRRVFNQADRYFTGNRLFINETTEYSWQSHHLQEMSAYYMQIENLLLKGTRIDAIGLQYHLFRKPEVLEEEAKILLNPSCLFDVMDTYGQFQRPMHISEITVPAYGGTEESMELQAEITRWLYRIWFSHPQMEGIVWWNFVDGTAAYAPLGSYEGENYYGGGLLSYDMKPKPVYRALDELLHKEWLTDLTLDSADGNVTFNGFFGEYTIEVEAEGIRQSHSLHLSKNGDRTFSLGAK